MSTKAKTIAKLNKPNIIVFRDKLLLPSEGFIKTHYTAFDLANVIYVANHFGWRAGELEGSSIQTASGSFSRFYFKQTGYTSILSDLKSLAARSMHAHFGRGGALALPLAKALGLPLYVTYHGGDATKETHQRHRIVPTIYQRRLAQLKEYAHAFLCVSQFVVNKLAAQGFPQNKLIKHYIGVDVANMQPPQKRQGRILFIGRLVEKKGVDILISAMRRLRDVGDASIKGLDIVGSGPLEADLRAQAADLSSIRFLGWQSQDHIRSLLCRAQAIVVPSRTASNGDCEGLPTVILESILAGLPVVASEHAGIPEIISNQVTGFLVPENDPDALAQTLLAQSKAGDYVNQMVVNAQALVKKDFNAAKQSKKLQRRLLGH